MTSWLPFTLKLIEITHSGPLVLHYTPSHLVFSTTVFNAEIFPFKICHSNFAAQIFPFNVNRFVSCLDHNRGCCYFGRNHTCCSCSIILSSLSAILTLCLSSSFSRSTLIKPEFKNCCRASDNWTRCISNFWPKLETCRPSSLTRS